jgi:hypothetical protein
MMASVPRLDMDLIPNEAHIENYPLSHIHAALPEEDFVANAFEDGLVPARPFHFTMIAISPDGQSVFRKLSPQ